MDITARTLIKKMIDKEVTKELIDQLIELAQSPNVGSESNKNKQNNREE